VAKVTDSYDLPEGIPVFLFVGRIVKYKGLPLILDALAKLSQDGVDFRMVFVGSGPDEKEMKEKAASLLKPEQYIFTGAVYDREQLRAWNTRADLFLFPSTYDTNGIVVREAAACGLASVLIGGSCAAEGITDDRNGFLIEETPDAMYRLLKRVGSDLAHLYDVGEHAMNEIYISWEDSVHSAYERYGEIIEAKKSGKLVLRHNAISGSMKNMQEKVQDSIKVTEEFGEECRNSFKKEYEMAYDEFLKEYEKISRIFHMH
jgi:glycosyltransferase involved in cell wall biosynthesis